MELVMRQNFLSPKEIEQRFHDFANTKTYRIMKEEEKRIFEPDFSNSIGVDLFFYDEETVQSTHDKNVEDLVPH